MAGNTIRSFIAVPIPDDLRRALGAGAEKSFGDINHVRTVRPGGMHITLKFLGDIKKERIESIGRVLSIVAGKNSSFTLKSEGIGGFPNLKNPRVLFAPLIGDAQKLIQMAADLDAALEKLGFEAEKRPFRAHLTLARVKTQKQLGLIRKRAGALEKKIFGEFKVEELILYRSDLRLEGARYTPLAGARLGSP